MSSKRISKAAPPAGNAQKTFDFTAAKRKKVNSPNSGSPDKPTTCRVVRVEKDGEPTNTWLFIYNPAKGYNEVMKVAIDEHHAWKNATAATEHSARQQSNALALPGALGRFR